MKRIIFKCTLLSDIIINAQSATEGTQETLDFIPGSNFLGIVAKDYSEFDNAYDVFHSGKVRFGDAHLAKNNEKSFKAPLSWFYNKGDTDKKKIWIHHALTKEIRERFLNHKDKEGNDDPIQIKQVRTDWVLKDGSRLKHENNFAIKSAYDRTSRRSKDAQMFGYKSLEAGSEWIFYVDIDNEINTDSIITKLVGEKNIGRSRSAQYGRVKIEKTDLKFTSQSSETPIDNKMIIYAESRLAFYDEFGQPNLQPKAEDFNLPKNYKICWELCQVKDQIFAPYKSINNASEADRVCFNKGSIFVFTGNEKIDLTKIESGVGAYLNEGFGQVVVNPLFMKADSNGLLAEIKLKKPETVKTEITSIKESDPSDALFVKWFSSQNKNYENEKKIYKAVTAFVEKNKDSFKNITPSQWGQIRTLATRSDSLDKLKEMLFKPATGDHSYDRADSGFLEHGKTADKWKNCKNILENEIENNESLGLDYIEKLAAQMQKNAKNKENEKGGE